MPDYEELYYIARNKYHQAIEDRNVFRRNMDEWQGERTVLIWELEQKQSALSVIRNNIMLFQEAISECRNILNNEFCDMKKNIQDTSIEYKKIFKSDYGVADIQLIYSSEITNTQADLNAVCSELDKKIKELENKEMEANRAVNDCSSALNRVISNINHAGSEAAVQNRINNFYTEMKEYEFRWLNGD